MTDKTHKDAQAVQISEAQTLEKSIECGCEDGSHHDQRNITCQITAVQSFFAYKQPLWENFYEKMKLEGNDDAEINLLWGEEPFLNRFRMSPKGVDANGNPLDRKPIGFYYGRMGEKTYKYVIKRVCEEAGIQKPVTPASLRRTGVTLMKVFSGASDVTISKATKHKLKNRGNLPHYIDSFRSDLSSPSRHLHKLRKRTALLQSLKAADDKVQGIAPDFLPESNVPVALQLAGNSQPNIDPGSALPPAVQQLRPSQPRTPERSVPPMPGRVEHNADDSPSELRKLGNFLEKHGLSCEDAANAGVNLRLIGSRTSRTSLQPRVLFPAQSHLPSYQAVQHIQPHNFTAPGCHYQPSFPGPYFQPSFGQYIPYSGYYGPPQVTLPIPGYAHLPYYGHQGNRLHQHVPQLHSQPNRIFNDSQVVIDSNTQAISSNGSVVQRAEHIVIGEQKKSN